MGSPDPDPDSQSGSGFRRAKKTQEIAIFLSKKDINKLSSVFFSQFLAIKTLDPDSLEMLDPDTDSINSDPQH